MKKIILLSLFLILSFSTYAASEFPGVFLTDGKFNGIIIVGNQGSASDVIAQSNLIRFFNSYTGENLAGKAKLSSEITDLNQNIISIGNPCVNFVSASIIGNPTPCDKDKQSVRLLKMDGYYQMVIFGASDIQTRQLTQDLIDGKINVYVESAPLAPKGGGKSDEAPKKDASQETIYTKKEAEPKENIIIENETPDKITEDKKQQDGDKNNESANKVTTVPGDNGKDSSIVKKFIDWLFSLFRK